MGSSKSPWGVLLICAISGGLATAVTAPSSAYAIGESVSDQDIVWEAPTSSMTGREKVATGAGVVFGAAGTFGFSEAAEHFINKSEAIDEVRRKKGFTIGEVERNGYIRQSKKMLQYSKRMKLLSNISGIATLYSAMYGIGRASGVVLSSMGELPSIEPWQSLAIWKPC